MRGLVLPIASLCVLALLSIFVSQSTELEAVSEGLELCLESDADSVAFGDEIELKATLSREGRGAIHCHIGWWYGQTFRSHIRFRARYLHPVRDGDEVPYRMLVGRCGTGSVPESVEISQRRPYVFTTPATLGRWREDKVHLRIEDLGLEVEAPCTIAITAVLRAGPRLYLDDFDAPRVDGKVWVGKVESNEVIINVLPVSLDEESGSAR